MGRFEDEMTVLATQYAVREFTGAAQYAVDRQYAVENFIAGTRAARNFFRDEIAAARAEEQALKQIVQNNLDATTSDRNRIRTRFDVIVECLRFYANPLNYVDRTILGVGKRQAKILLDKGSRASETLNNVLSP